MVIFCVSIQSKEKQTVVKGLKLRANNVKPILRFTFRKCIQEKTEKKREIWRKRFKPKFLTYGLNFCFCFKKIYADDGFKIDSNQEKKSLSISCMENYIFFVCFLERK
jgi:hypothetical protein